MSRLFDSIQIRAPRRSKFDLSHEKKMGVRMGTLTPIMLEEILPGDSFRVNTEIFLRMVPMLAPIMHRVNVYCHYFFVPNRLVWTEWEDFITGGRLGTAAPVLPTGTINDTLANTGLLGVSTLADYMGLPTVESPITAPASFSILPFRGYQTIYNEFYRDQNLTDPVTVDLTSGVQPDAQVQAMLQIRKRAWEKDYFTSALPFAQRGPDVNIPFGEASVIYKPESLVVNSFTDSLMDGPNYMQVDPAVSGGTPKVSGGLQIGDSTGTGVTPGQQVRIENIEEIEASGTIRELRRSIRLQEWLEKAATAGGRYAEQLRSFFKVRPDDARLQRPEFLGGGRQPVTISEVLNMTADGTTPQGEMAGHGVSVGSKSGFKRRFKEHGYVFGIMSVIPKTAYQQGIPRHFSRTDKFDFAFPEFAHIGEQEVKYQELYYDKAEASEPNLGTFGYQSRYAEYKYGCSTVHGEFKTNRAFWHMGRIFTAQPLLDESFVMSDPTTRIFPVAEDTLDKCFVYLYNRIDAVRPLPYFGTPTL